MILLLDIGNSRCKWARLQDSQLMPMPAMTYQQEDRARLIVEGLAGAMPERVIVSSVLGGAFASDLIRHIQARFGLECEFVQTQSAAFGIRIAYAKPENLGVDRYVAMIGAHANYRRACVLVDCGTAVTIDALTADGQHLGGLIFPGLKTMQDALIKQTANIKRDEVRGDAVLFAKDTVQAVYGGCLRTLVAAIDTLTAAMAAQMGEVVMRILSGGDAELLAGRLNDQYELDRLLVIKGLRVIASG